MTRAGGITRRPRTLLQLDFRQPPALELFCLESRRGHNGRETECHCSPPRLLAGARYYGSLRTCDAPSLDIIPALPAANAGIVAFDPERTEEADRLMP